MTKAYLQPRSVAVAIPYRLASSTSQPLSRNQIQICLVSSRKHSGAYVLPKGGIEQGETSLTAAVRELYEEAGLKPAQDQPPLSRTLPHDLVVADHKPHKKSAVHDPADPQFIPRAIYTAHEIRIDSDGGELSDWPEKDERIRQWFDLDEALRRIAWRKDIAVIMDQWSRGIPA